MITSRYECILYGSIYIGLFTGSQCDESCRYGKVSATKSVIFIVKYAAPARRTQKCVSAERNCQMKLIVCAVTIFY